MLRVNQFCFVLAVALCVGYVFAAVSIERANPKRKEGHCLPSLYNLELKHGESDTPEGQCVRVSCHDDGSVDYASCGLVGAKPPCKVGSPDLSKPYPDCCPGVVC